MFVLSKYQMLTSFYGCVWLLFVCFCPVWAEQPLNTIIELKNAPDVYHNRPVHLKGRIVETQIAPRGLTAGHYILEDNTGRLPVRTSKLPALNDLVEVWGQFLKDQDEPYFMHLHESKRCCPEYIAGSGDDSHKEKDSKENDSEKSEPFWQDLSPTVLAGLSLIALSLLGLIVFFVLKAKQKQHMLRQQEQQQRELEQKRRDALMLRLQQGGGSGGLTDQTLVPGQSQRSSTGGDVTTVGYPVGKLEVIEGPETGKSYSVMAPKTLIGKQAGPGGVLAQSQDPLLSKQHAEILATVSGQCRLVDKQSRNGTRLNGQPVSEATLKDQDIIEVGSHKLRFHLTATHGSSEKTKPHTEEQPGVHNVHEQVTIVRRLPSLEVLKGPDQGKTVRILKERWLVGRSQENDMVLSDTTVSRSQFALEWREE